jgi:CDP-glycerol glycerophosphotransferase (TagB/SpsB family)
MTLQEFIEKFDTENSIVLLEGKRKVLNEDSEKLIALGKLLASRTSKIIFRSGNAEGSDDLFSQGVCSIDQKRLQVITPYNGHRNKQNLAYETFSLDNINFAAEDELIYQSKANKKTVKLIDDFVSGIKNRNTIKAAYIIRDTVKVLGTETIKPASFGIFYTDLNDPDSGGTGHTMNVCRLNGIPLIDQKVWFEWIK